MIEDLGLAETHMNEAVPNMGWKKAQYIRRNRRHNRSS